MDEPSLIDSLEHFKTSHTRWMERRNRRAESPEYKDEWLSKQCLECRYYIPLIGAFTEDYGACSNSRSPFDGTVRFEHDGCEEFSRASSPDDEYWDRFLAEEERAQTDPSQS